MGFNFDYTEYSLIRDKQIQDLCDKNNLEFICTHDDYVMIDMELLLREPNIPYKQYGAFKKNILTCRTIRRITLSFTLYLQNPKRTNIRPQSCSQH